VVLRGGGFEVIIETNVNKRTLETALAEFGRLSRTPTPRCSITPVTGFSIEAEITSYPSMQAWSGHTCYTARNSCFGTVFYRQYDCRCRC
jgi:hypothetical protein